MTATGRSLHLCHTPPGVLACVVFALLILAGNNLRAQSYSPPANHRSDTILDTGWRFILQDVTNAQATNFDDSSWGQITIPHTWNNLDGQDGGNNYYRGVGWYRVHTTVNSPLANHELFLKFDGAFSDADVYVNGTFVGEHQGGFAAFTYDVTALMNVGADNVIAVKVSNAFNTNIPPLDADFTFFGGLYRDLHLLATDPVQISPLDYGSPGIYLKTTAVSSNSATLQVTAGLSNASSSAQSLMIRTVVTDAATNIVAALTNFATLSAGAGSNIVAVTNISSPHLWNGLSDPYLYQTFTEVWSGTNVLDLVAQPLGFRYYNVDPSNGFFLNGKHYDLHGVNMHQDWLNCGWALTNAQRDSNFVFLKEIGATFVRFSHYEHNDCSYQLADQAGICIWSEVPVIDYITASSQFYTNTLQQLREMIRQRLNHPSVICWSVFNEITLEAGPTPTNLISQEVQLVGQEDPTRFPTAANNTSDNDPSTTYTQTLAFNKYFGWYSSPLNGIASWADNFHSNYPTRAVGVTEYGAGASIYQHSEAPTFPANTATGFHPEEWQNIVHETNWILMAARPFLWCKLLWTEFDFASDARNEGDTPGRNDKGLATYDRQTRKDAFYFYKANWTTNPVVYITGHTFTNRFTNAITAKVYANCDSVQLFLNGVSQGVATSSNTIFTWNISLLAGTNSVQAIGTKGGSNVTDSLVWIGPVAPPVVSIVAPVGAVGYLNSTNDTLWLSASVSNPVPTQSMTTSWAQTSGPGTVQFSNPNSLSTGAKFSSNGLYGINFIAYNGSTNVVPIAVVVGTNASVTNGLLAWWKMSETNGASAGDSSGNGRTATLGNATFTNFPSGYPSNGLHFNGTSSYASFSSPAATNITLVAWARAVAQGNSQYPRIFDMPGYRLFFRFDTQANDGFDFATYATGNGDWSSGVNTIGTGAWYHVAAAYDSTSFANVPQEYVNGTPIASPMVITTPSGTQPSNSGTGYLGNLAALNRAWSGELSDVRIYNRILSGSEVRFLASAPVSTYPPSVDAGTNISVVWPGSASLAGTITTHGTTVTNVAWTALAGPGTVNFGNPNALSTTASLSQPGQYTLQLQATDGHSTTLASVAVNSATPSISVVIVSNALKLSWNGTNANWRLEYQSNSLTAGLATNWTLVSGTPTNPFSANLPKGPGAMFYRLIYQAP